MDKNHYDVILGVPFIGNKGLVLDLNEERCYFKFKPSTKINLQLPVQDGTLNEIKIGCTDMRKEIENLIKAYPNVFTTRIGKALDLKVHLQVTDDKPICIKPYYLSPPAIKKMKAIIDDWLSQGIIEISTSPYSAPAFLTNKDRLVVNYTELNKKLVKMNYPIGDLNNLYQHLQGAKIYTVIDLNKAFLQCPLSEESKHLTSFSTSFGKYCMNRVCFGLQVGSSVLSSYLDKIFHDIKFDYLIFFCDDLVVFSKDKTSHLAHVKEVVRRVDRHNLTVNPEKVKFFCKEISFLGHLIRDNTITIDPERTKSIREFPAPKSVKQTRQFVGMCQYWSKYIQNYAELCRPLHRLKRKGVKFRWTVECQEAFEKLKERISNPPVLQLANFDKPFVLQTDASNYGAGGILLQRNQDNDLLPVAYYSKKFTDAELRYSIYEKEALSAILCMEFWHQYLEVKPFTLITDNQALSYVLNTKRKLGRLARWVERLMNLDYTVEHRKSSENLLADCLSRLYREDRNENEHEDDEDKENNNSENGLKSKINFSREVQNEKRPNMLNQRVVNKNETMKINNKVTKIDKKEEINYCKLLDEIPLAFTQLEKQQSQDEKCQNIVHSIKNKQNNHCYYMKNNILMHKGTRGKCRIYLPEILFNVVFTFYHNSIFGGHFGIARTLSRINEYFYNPNLERFVKEKIKTCNLCLMSKQTQRKYEGKLISIPIEECMHTVFLDIYGPLTRTKSGHKFILILVDGFSRFTWLFPLKECTSKLIIEKMKTVFANFSIPKTLVTDNASYLTSKLFKAFLFRNYIIQRAIPSYRANGNRCERFLRDLGALLRCYYHDKQDSWDTELDMIQISLNTAVNSSTKNSAFKLMFTHEPNCGLSNLWDLQSLVSERLTPDQRQENLKRAVNNVRRSIQRNRARDKYFLPRTRHPYKINSLVYIKTHYLSNKIKNFSKKLAPKYSGPYRILYFFTSVTVLVQNVSNVTDVRKIHVVDLKLYKT